MNLMLLQPGDYISSTQARITGRRLEHAIKVLKAQAGDLITVGNLNGNVGEAEVGSIDSHALILKVGLLKKTPSPNLPVKLILGLPRPQMLKRILQTVSTMGVQELHLLQTARVEKSFWQTPQLAEAALQEHLFLGLEQGKATQPPAVHFHKRFIPFVEDTLPGLLLDVDQALIAHPCDATPTKLHTTLTALAVGPEGGFLDKEVQQFLNLGFSPLNLGDRILKVETAVPVALTKLFL